MTRDVRNPKKGTPEDYLKRIHECYYGSATIKERFDNITLIIQEWNIAKEDIMKEEDKPCCFGCYGYRICVERTKLPSQCVWEKRCYHSQRDY